MFNSLQTLRHPRLALRLQLIVAVSLLCLLVLGGLAVRENTWLMWDDRVDKLHAVLEQAVSMAADLDRQVQAGRLTHEQALRQWRDTVRPIRYDGGAGYYFSYGMDGMTVVLGPTPQVEGTSRYMVTDADGKLWVQEMIAAAGRGGGTVVYRYPKPGSTVAQPKLAYVLPVPGWDLFVATGLYVDDVEAATLAAVLRFGGFAAALVLLCVGVAWRVSRSITRPLAHLRQAMAGLARGELDAVVPGTDRRDEVGDMAAAVLVFRDSMAEAARLRGAGDLARQAAAQAQAAARADMADSFENRIGHLVNSLSVGAGGLESTARAMTASADVSNREAAAVAAAAEQAGARLNTVAAATDELSASITEITRQVAQSAHIAGRAVDDARRTDTIVKALAEAAEKIGAGQSDYRHRRADKPARAQRHHRGGAGRRGRSRLCRGGQ